MASESNLSTFHENGVYRRRVAENAQYSPSDEEEEENVTVTLRKQTGQQNGVPNGDGGTPFSTEFVNDEMEESLFDQSMVELRNELPSRQLDALPESVTWTALRRRATVIYHATMTNNRHREDDLVDSLEREIDLVDSSPQNIVEAVRTMPTTLSRKRNIKRRLSSRRKTNLTRTKLVKYWFGMFWQQTKYQFRKWRRIFDLWSSHLTVIEGCFGTSVASYFIFLKWVLLMNIPIFLLTFGFLVIPQILYRFYQLDPSGYEEKYDSFTGIEILTGAGFFTHTEMYYGFYTDEAVEIVTDLKYKMKYAYLLTCGGYYLFCLILLGYSYLKSYRKYYIDAGGTISLYYFNLVYCGWDYGIKSQEASALKQSSIYQEIKEYLNGSNMDQANRKSRQDMCRKWAFIFFSWLVVLSLLAGSGYLTYTVSIELSIKPELDNSTSIPVVSSLAMPVVLSTIQLFVPMIFTLLEKNENYSQPKYELYVHMFRDMALKATMLAVLVYFWFKIAAYELECWETFVGEEIYRLVIVDLIFTLGYSFFMEFCRKLISQKLKSVERAEFATGRHTLELVYSQSLCWLGLFYCPLLPVVVILKLIIIFYIKRFSVVQNCRPSLKPWRASRTHTIFVGYLFVFFILSCIAVGFGIFLIEPSISCGPYKNYDTSYQVMTDVIDKWKEDNDVVKEAFSFITSPGFISGLLVFLGMILYYTRTVMLSHRERVEQFKIQLASEGKDKKFLLNLLNQVRVRGRRASKHPGPRLHRTMEAISPSQSAGGKVFVKSVAEGALIAPANN
ncbi:transmembrane channel-like protein [Elysia marginata]|uniref:Transmembrane channel-like protein n=1 Tax=Elysia marginata TaxID=1093978 RepID=A0AAV4FHD4_9GAST|nr:transmembrane channel-like protein [Elysia marginata]